MGSATGKGLVPAPLSGERGGRRGRGAAGGPLRLFDLVVMVDWSAAADRGPGRPTPNRCWLAWGTPAERTPPLYLRTRKEAEEKLRALLVGVRRVLACFDFGFGYPESSALGGGRGTAERLARLIEDHEDGTNNRFRAAAGINRRLTGGPAPFWGCPRVEEGPTLSCRKPDLAAYGIEEYRIVERRLRERGGYVKSGWQLYGNGAVGGQTLTGLPVVYRLAAAPGLTGRALFWPFETGWDEDLDGIVFAEAWPGLHGRSLPPHPIKDAAQAMAVRDWALALDAEGKLRSCLARPAGLTAGEERTCRRREGWILGAS